MSIPFGERDGLALCSARSERYPADVHKWLMMMLVIGCGAPPAPTDITPPAPATPRMLRFDPQGTHLLVDETWRVTVATGQVEPLASHPEARLLFAADGRIAQLAPNRLWIDDQRIALPAIQSPPVADRTVHGVWLDLDRLYVHEWHPVKRSGACRIYDRRTAGLTRPARCITTARPLQIQAGPGDLTFLIEVGPAGPIAALMRFDALTPPERIWQIDLRPDGQVEAAFDPSGAALYAASRCALTQTRPCVDPLRTPRPAGFRYDLLDAVWQPLESWPIGAVPGPQGQFAWPIAGGFCIHDPGLATAVCRSLVPGAPRGYTAPHVDVDHP